MIDKMECILTCSNTRNMKVERSCCLPNAYIRIIFVSFCTINIAIYLGKWVIKFVSSQLDTLVSHFQSSSQIINQKNMRNIRQNISLFANMTLDYQGESKIIPRYTF